MPGNDTKLSSLLNPFCWNQCCPGCFCSITEGSIGPSLHTWLLCCSSHLLCPLIVIKFLKGRGSESPAVWGTILWSQTSHLSRLSTCPLCPLAGCLCHSLTDRYKVTSVCSGLLNSPLSLSCPRTMPDCPTRLTCLFVSLLNYGTSWFLCTPAVIENMWLKKGKDVHHWMWLHPKGVPVKWSLWKMIRHVASSLWGLKRLLCRC